MSAKRKRLENQLIELRIASKQMQAEARRASRKEAVEKLKCKKAIERGITDSMRVHAENAIRAKNESLSLLRLASRVDAVASRVQSALNMNMVTSSMSSIVRIMSSMTGNRNVWRTAATMDRFEHQFAELDMQMALVEQSVDRTVVTSTPCDQVNELVAKVGDEHQLDLACVLDADELEVARTAIGSASAGGVAAASSSASASTRRRQAVAADADALSIMDRLATLNPSSVAPGDGAKS